MRERPRHVHARARSPNRQRRGTGQEGNAAGRPLWELPWRQRIATSHECKVIELRQGGFLHPPNCSRGPWELIREDRRDASPKSCGIGRGRGRGGRREAAEEGVQPASPEDWPPAAPSTRAVGLSPFRPGVHRELECGAWNNPTRSLPGRRDLRENGPADPPRCRSPEAIALRRRDENKTEGGRAEGGGGTGGWLVGSPSYWMPPARAPGATTMPWARASLQPLAA